MDVSGEQHIDVDHNIYKQRLDPSGAEIQDESPEKEGSPNHLVKSLPNHLVKSREV